VLRNDTFKRMMEAKHQIGKSGGELKPKTIGVQENWTCLKRYCYRISVNNWFIYGIMILILLNTLALASEHFGQGDVWTNALGTTHTHTHTYTHTHTHTHTCTLLRSYYYYSFGSFFCVVYPVLCVYVIVKHNIINTHTHIHTHTHTHTYIHTHNTNNKQTNK